MVRDTVIIDPKSHLTIDAVYAQRDSGGFDDPRMTVRAAYNILDGEMIMNRPLAPGEELIYDPKMITFGKAGSRWWVQWDPGVVGTTAVEQTADGPRLKVTILSNPYNRRVLIGSNFVTPSASVGKRGVATWRIDGKYFVQMFNKNYVPYNAQAMNTKTGARSPEALQRHDSLIAVFHKARGTYYLSKFSVRADIT